MRCTAHVDVGVYDAHKGFNDFTSLMNVRWTSCKDQPMTVKSWQEKVSNPKCRLEDLGQLPADADVELRVTLP